MFVLLPILGSAAFAYCQQAGGNEFPLAQSEAAAGQNSAPQQKGSTAQQNPFPEKQSQAAATSETNSSAPGYSSSDANLPPPDVGEGTMRSHQKLDTFTRDQTTDGRIEDDLKVADMYMGYGNYRGALLRYQDAVQYDPQNEAALFGIADAMCRQNMTSEAMARFKSFARAHPQSRYALKAEKTLAHPNRCEHNR